MKMGRYDRQLRIWGPKGQKALSEASVAIIGCSGPSIEAAKNLILPGVGKIDIWDNSKI
jgi:NEDD8-activating enzyme E1 regulatory subunit